jgi:hypothetical protein
MNGHATLIEALGGATILAGKLGVARTTVVHWKRRGIPWRLRARVKRLAVARSIKVPARFLEG